MPDELVGFLSEVESLDGELTLPKTMADLDEKTITANGTYTASADDLDGYSQVVVNVPNTYTSSDEGKVVDDGALVAQGSATYTVNNTYDTTTISSVTVNVSGGGSPTLETVTKTYTPTTSQQTETITPSAGYDGIGEVDVTVNAMPTGTLGNPVAVKGTVSNHSMEVTPVVSTQAGYIATQSKSGTAVTVSASELDSGTKSITANGNNQDVVGYAAVDVAVPNSYSVADEGKVVSSGALVAQTAHADVTPTTSDQTIDTTTNNSIKVKGDADLIATNIKKDVEIFGVTGSYEGGGGGGGVDLTDVAVPVSQNTMGGMFQAMIDGYWDSLELTVTSGTNPIQIDFGRTIKGYVCYPKEITVLDGLATGEAVAFAICLLSDPDAGGAQTISYNVVRWKNNGMSQGTMFNRTASYTMTNGLLSLVPTYPSNANYHPFGFGKPYIFVYWW